MSEHIVEYLANALWQLPLLAAGAWWLLRAVRVGLLAQHRLWVAVLVLGVSLPLARVGPQTVTVRPNGAAIVAAFGTDRAEGMSSQRELAGTWHRTLLRRHRVEISAGAARWIAMLYLLATGFGLMRLLRGWAAARRLVREAAMQEDAALSEPLRVLLTDCSRRLDVETPSVLASGEVSSPAIVGSLKPVVLLPEAFGDYGHEEMRAALLHEMAHIRRGDYAANLLCEMAAVPLVWHPIVHAVQSRIRSTREMVCDAVAAGEMTSAVAYARALVGLAEKAFAGGPAEAPVRVGLFTNDNLEERVMKLTETKQTVDARVRPVRVLSAVAGMVGVVSLAAMVHLTPAMAQTAIASAAQATTPVQTSPSVAEQPATEAATPASAPAATGQANPPNEAIGTGVASGVSDGVGNGVRTGVVAPPMNGVSGSTDASTASTGTSTSTGTGHGMAFVTGQSEGTGASSSEPVGMAKGAGAYVEQKHGYWMHKWTAADGEPFEIMNKQKAEPTPEEKKRFEEQFAQQQAKAQTQMAAAEAQLNSSEFKDEMAKINSPQFKQQMAAQMQELKTQMAAFRLDSKEAQKQMAEVQRMMHSPEMQKQMAELRDGTMQAELEAQMAAMRAQIDSTVNLEIQKQIGIEHRKELEEQLKAAQKELEAARKELQAERLKQKEAPAKP